MLVAVVYAAVLMCYAWFACVPCAHHVVSHNNWMLLIKDSNTVACSLLGACAYMVFLNGAMYDVTVLGHGICTVSYYGGPA